MSKSSRRTEPLDTRCSPRKRAERGRGFKWRELTNGGAGRLSRRRRPRFSEKLVEHLFAGGPFGGIPEYVTTHFTWHRFFAIQIWIFVLFLIYTSVSELNARLGNGELRKILFSRRSSETKLKPPAADSRAHQA